MLQDYLFSAHYSYIYFQLIMNIYGYIELYSLAQLSDVSVLCNLVIFCRKYMRNLRQKIINFQYLFHGIASLARFIAQPVQDIALILLESFRLAYFGSRLPKLLFDPLVE